MRYNAAVEIIHFSDLAEPSLGQEIVALKLRKVSRSWIAVPDIKLLCREVSSNWRVGTENGGDKIVHRSGGISLPWAE